MKLLRSVTVLLILITVFVELSKCEQRQSKQSSRRDKRGDKYHNQQSDDSPQPYTKRKRKYDEFEIDSEPESESEPQRIQFMRNTSDENDEPSNADESSEEQELVVKNKITANALKTYNSKKSSGNGKKRKKIVVELKNPPPTPLSNEDDDDEDDDYEPEIEIIEPRYKRNNRRRKRYRMYRHINKYDDASFESYEAPVRYKRKYEYHAEERPLYNLILGILETVKVTTQNELRRAEEKERHQQTQIFIDELKNGIRNVTAILLPNNNSV